EARRRSRAEASGGRRARTAVDRRGPLHPRDHLAYDPADPSWGSSGVTGSSSSSLSSRSSRTWPGSGSPPVSTRPSTTCRQRLPKPPPRSPRTRRTAENAFIVDRREVAGAVDNVSGLMTQLRAVAEVREGRPAGFRLFQIRDDSLFAKLGLRNGDVVERVNGAQVADPTALLG